MIAILFAAALSAEPPAFAYFKAEVARQAQARTMPIPTVVVIDPLPRPGPWGWVNHCPYEMVDGVAHVTWCAPVISIRRDVLQWLGLDALRMMALHEVLHLWRGDHRDPVWQLEDEDSRREQKRLHDIIGEEVMRAFDSRTLEAAGRQRDRWVARWARR
jgi:hypothetical protein